MLNDKKLAQDVQMAKTAMLLDVLGTAVHDDDMILGLFLRGVACDVLAGHELMLESLGHSLELQGEFIKKNDSCLSDDMSESLKQALDELAKLKDVLQKEAKANEN